MSPRIIVIHNPTAGRRRRHLLGEVCRHLAERGASVIQRPTWHRGHARAIAADVTQANWDVLAIAGGDGTINEVINGLGPDAPPIAVIPLGTANVLAREIGLGPDPAAIAEVICAGRQVLTRIGRANDHRFIMMAGVGFDSRVVKRVYPGLKRLIGRGAYVLAGLHEAISSCGPQLAVRVDGEVMACHSVIVANGRHYAGRYVLAPDADLAADTFIVCLFQRRGAWHLLRYGYGLVTGRLPEFRDVLFVEAKEIFVPGPLGEAVQTDGDFAITLPLVIRKDPQVIRLLAPSS